ncbi:MAG: hypothetical protein PHF60_04530 [Candidatus ainarchaeum sp.]|nr:hypothetical protein [Candidatus ainarchaeum sp.]
MRSLFIVLLLFGLSMAFTVHPNYIEIKDTGNENLDTMEVGITVDCDSKMLTVSARANDTDQPIANADIYLFYTDYGYQVIGTGETGADGTGTIDVIGNVNYLTGLFILRVDNPQFRSRETEFTYEKCFEEQQTPPPPHNETPPADDNPPQQNETPPDNQTPPEPPPDHQNQSPPGENGTGQPITPPPPSGSSCLPAFLLPLILIMMRR